MSEVQEVSIPQESKDVPPLNPEVEEQRQAAFERVQAEAQDPSAVISRSIDDMGFFEGLLKVTEPYRKEKVNIMWKNLKAKTSLVLSLIPVVGEGKAFLGIVKEGKKIVGFEPAARTARAFSHGKNVFTKTMNVEKKATSLLGKIGESKIVRAPVGVIKGAFATKHGYGVIASRESRNALIKLYKEYPLYRAKYEAAVHAKNIYKLKKAEEATSRGVKEKVAWFDAIGKYKLWRSEVVAKKASKAAYTSHLRTAIGEKITSTGKIGSWVQEKKTMLPTEVGVGLKKKKFMALFDEVFNLTPDVPFWLTLTTGVAEAIGAHGADAIPAVLQLGKNSFHEAKITKSMMKDVFQYTSNRLLGSRDLSKSARDVYKGAQSVQAEGAA